MELEIFFKNIESTDAIKNYVEKRVKKFTKILGDNIEIKVTLSTEKFRQIAEIIINFKGIIIKGEESSNDMYSAIDLVVDKVERQIKKYREKLKERKFGGNEKFEINMKILSSDETEEPKIIKSEKFFIKPLSVEEAVMQLDLLNQEFLVFRNSETNEINVVYKRKDGNYGWIEPETVV